MQRRCTGRSRRWFSIIAAVLAASTLTGIGLWNSAPQDPETAAYEEMMRARTLQEAGSREAALDTYRSAAQKLDALAAQRPGDAWVNSGRMFVNLHIGQILFEIDDFPGAAEACKLARNLGQQALQRNPSDLNMQRHLVEALVWLSVAQGRSDDMQEAFQSAEAAVQVGRDLAQQTSNRPEAIVGLTRASANLGDLLVRLGQFRRGLDLLAEVVQNAEAMGDRTGAAWASAAEIRAHTCAGNAHQWLGELDDALVQLRTADALCTEARRRDPERLEWVEASYHVKLGLGEILRRPGTLDESLSALREAFSAASEQCSRDETANAQWDVCLARCAMANALRMRGDLASAEGESEAAVEIARSILRGDQTTTTDRSLFAHALMTAGKVASAEGDAARARAMWEEAAQGLGPPPSQVPLQWQTVMDIAVRADSLLLLDRAEEARPLVDHLFGLGVRDPEFLEVCAQHGLVSMEASGEVVSAPASL